MGMTDLTFDATTGELTIASNDLSLLTMADLVRQNILRALRTHRGEWFLDITAGVPWREFLTARPFNSFAATAWLKNYIKSLWGVKAVDTLTIEVTNEPQSVATITFTARTEDDDVLSGEITI